MLGQQDHCEHYCSLTIQKPSFLFLHHPSIHMGSGRFAKALLGVTYPSQITVEKYQRLLFGGTRLSTLLEYVTTFLQRLITHVLCTGPIPGHVAFIMDGNRRYEKKHNMEAGGGHNVGFLALMSLLKHCYLSGVKYVTVYAFSIDNFKRPAAEVNLLMNLMRDKIEDLLREESFINQFGIRIYFIGNLKLLEESVRLAAERAMRATANNSNATLLICVAYTSTDEIIHAIEKSCKGQLDGTHCEARSKVRDDSMVHLAEVEKHLYMSMVPDPDILIRSSGESRLSNFLLWQTVNTLLCAPRALWPEMGFKDLCWAIINFQRSYSYIEKRRKQA